MSMATSFFYIYVMATSFFYIYIGIYIYKLTERPVILLNAIFDDAWWYFNLGFGERFWEYADQVSFSM